MPPRKQVQPAEPEKIRKAPEVEPKTPQEIATQMAKDGVPEAVILATLTAQFGGGDNQGSALATPGSGEMLGPDPKMVAAYKERMKDYVKPQTRFNFNALNQDDKKLRSLIMDVVTDVDQADAIMEKLHGYGGVSLPKMFMEWCVQWQYWQMTIRKMPAGEVFSEAKTLEDMIRFHWFNHPQERAQLTAARNPNQTTGLANTFSPASGGWTKP